MSESNAASEDSKIRDKKFMPQQFITGSVLLSIALFVGIPGVMLGQNFYIIFIIGGLSFGSAIVSLAVFGVDYFSSNRKYIISGSCVIFNLLAICLIALCSLVSMNKTEQRLEIKRKYLIMDLAFNVERDKKLTGKYTKPNEFYEKHSDKIQSGDIWLYYIPFGGEKGFGIEGEKFFGGVLVFNSEFPELGVVRLGQLPKEGDWWDPDFEWGKSDNNKDEK